MTYQQAKETRMKTHKLLAVVVVLQGIILLGQWTGSGYLTSAAAQIPDPANRQMQMVDELKSVNGKLDTLIDLLKGGDLQVKVAKSDENKGESAPRK
jgi:hypothetical protein